MICTKFYISNFQANYLDWWLRYLLWNCPHMSHWFGQWLGAARQQAITRAIIDPDLCRHLVSLGHNVLAYWGMVVHAPLAIFFKFHAMPIKSTSFVRCQSLLNINYMPIGDKIISLAINSFHCHCHFLWTGSHTHMYMIFFNSSPTYQQM